MSQPRELVTEVHTIFNIVRQLISDNLALTETIDTAYEQTLINELSLIPVQYDADILKVFRVIRSVIKNMAFNNIADDITDIAGDAIRFEVNTFKACKYTFDHLTLSRVDRARIMNIVTKFKPLFTCIDSMLSRPVELIRKISNMQDSAYSDILG